MGLAVSIVASEHKEKVWYYDRRKWEGRQLSTKLASEGGCCIWYDEPALLRGVTKRLGGTPIETLDDFLTRQPGGVQALAAYGQAKDGGLNEASQSHLRTLAPAVSELAALEVVAQHSFLCGMPLALRGGGAPVESGLSGATGGAPDGEAMDVSDPQAGGEAPAAASEGEALAQGAGGGSGRKRGHQRRGRGRGH